MSSCWLIDKHSLTRMSTTSLLWFTAVTPVESDAAWLLACGRSDVFFYSIMEAAPGGTVAGIFVYNIA